MKWWSWLLVFTGLALRPGSAWAQLPYTVQTIVKAGDPAGALRITPLGGEFTVLGLDDSGRLDFLAWTGPDATDPRTTLIEESGGRLTPLYRELDPLGSLVGPTLDVPAAAINDSGQVAFAVVDGSQKRSFVQYSAGKLPVIATEGRDAPGGKWQSVDILRPFMMNQSGDIVFQGLVGRTDGSLDSALFRWDGGKGQVVLVAGDGTRTSDNVALKVIVPGTEAINNHGAITFAAAGVDAGGNLVAGLYLLDASGSARPVALDDQALPDGDKIGSAMGSVLDDSGGIAFLALRKSDVAEGVYRWENGSITATGIVAGTAAPGGGTFVRIDGLWINPLDRSLLVAAALANDDAGLVGLYRFASGRLSAAAVPGQAMPDGATNAGPPSGDWQISPFNAAGQVAFVTQLADGSTAAYVMAADGNLTLLLKEGMPTSLGPVTHVGSENVSPHLARFPTGLNNHGQVALRAQLSAGGGDSDALFVLTPH
jgi:hypothetical protein